MELGLGGWQFGSSFGFWSNQNLNESKNTINYALSHEIRHFDTAIGYNNGSSEQLLGQQLRKANIERQQLFFATKLMPTTSTNIEKLIDKSLDRLFTTYLDLVYIHWPKKDFNYNPLLKQLVDLKEKGKIKNLGLSNFNLKDLATLSTRYPIKYYQRPVSLFWSKTLDQAIKFCSIENIKLVGYSPLGLGTLTGKYNCKENLQENDSRRDLYIYKKAYYPLYLDLMKSLKEIAENNNTNCAKIALAWAASKNPTVLLSGVSTREQLKENLKFTSISESELQELNIKTAILMEKTPKTVDNYFFHSYH